MFKLFRFTDIFVSLLMTFIRVSYNKSTDNILLITQKMREKTTPKLFIRLSQQQFWSHLLMHLLNNSWYIIGILVIRHPDDGHNK